MKVIDAHTGKQIKIGDKFKGPDGGLRELLGVAENMFSAKAYVDTPQGQKVVPLIVRYMHPQFFLQKVAFYPS